MLKFVRYNLTRDGSRYGLYLFGEAGTGKSYIARQLADVLSLDYYQDSKIDMAFSLQGYTDVNGKYVTTNFRKAWENGGIYCLDEMDASDPQAVIYLNGALGSNICTFPDGIVKRHKDFFFVGTGNTCGTGATEKYSARCPIDDSTLNRVKPIKVDYDRRLDLYCADNDEALANFAADCRRAFDAIGYNGLFTYRDIEKIKLDEKLGFDVKESLEESAFVGKDVDTLRNIYEALDDKENRFAKELRKLF